MRKVLILGAGTAGLSAARALSERGVPSILVERTSILGGMAVEFGCKGLNECVRCDVCLARDLVSEVKRSDLIERVKGADIAKVSGKPGDFMITLSDLASGNGGRHLSAGAIICAIGYEPFDAALEPRLGYGIVPGVVSALDVERQLKERGKVVLSSGLGPKSVAFIQCVGSRDKRFRQELCSRACCKYSFKMAQLLRRADPDASISFHYMDWRLNDPRENVRKWASGQKGVELLRSRPAEVFSGEDGRPTIRFVAEGDARVEEKGYDLVVLSVGIGPSAQTSRIARVLGVEADGFGFLRSNPGDACVSTRPGIFLAGCCRGPKDIVESAKDGQVAAHKAFQFLEGGL
jgi:heterodisulfide reductase subunit A2